MASILQVGERWRAQVRRKGFHTYCRTFATHAQAKRWAEQVEQQMALGRKPDVRMVRGVYLVRDAVHDYCALRATSRPVQEPSNEHFVLERLKRLLGEMDVTALGVDDLVQFCQARQEEGAGPYTVNQDVGKLGTVLRLVSGVKHLELPDVVTQARPALQHLGLIGSGHARDRRLEGDELQRITAWLRENRGAVYADVVQFAVLTAMRRAEFCRVTWEDVDVERRMVLVRDRKDPRHKLGNDAWVPLLNGAWELVQAQPTRTGRIFPVHPQTVTTYFSHARKALGIEGLRLHDLRHEGVSELFEQGFSIPEVALVSGHKKWSTLKKYTNLRPESLHDGPRGARKR